MSEEKKRNGGGGGGGGAAAAAYTKLPSDEKRSSTVSETTTTKKAIIKSADMKEDLQKEAIDCAISAFEKHNVEKDIAEYIKKEFDKKHGPTWHCIVGRNFGASIVTATTTISPIALYHWAHRQRHHPTNHCHQQLAPLLPSPPLPLSIRFHHSTITMTIASTTTTFILPPQKFNQHHL
ncbi:Dynein light chain [Macleaya cordata]|uniref:Dynein light chain n=1 Tax=Macleaya cordata TaxID=56857 RepID=A0A200QSM0_MACCD|nr:Dynein light chain [Macleaya cordata]